MEAMETLTIMDAARTYCSPGSGLHCRYKRKRTALPGVSAIRSITVLILQTR
ncbi:hypothetical protein CBL_04754 [Carabus blaptoides fortunei]